MSDIQQEKLIEEQPKPIPIEDIGSILSQMEKCICKIFFKKGAIGTGFFVKYLLIIIYYQY